MKGVMSVFGRKAGNQLDAGGVTNIIWLCDNADDKRHPGQWLEENFYNVWLKGMERAFDLLGMKDRYRQFTQEVRGPELEVRDGLVPARGWQNRHLLRRMAENVDAALTAFRLVPVQGGKALRYGDGREKALEQWEALMDLTAKTTVVALVTPGLQYYVEGSQVGYTTATRHLFKNSNTVERVGSPMDLAWELSVSGYRLLISGKWSDIEETHRETGYNIFQLLQLRINEGLEEAIKREG